MEKNTRGYQCLDISICSQELEDSPWQQNDLGIEYKQLNLLKSTPTLKQSCDRTIQEYQSMTTSGTTTQNQESLTSSLAVSPVLGQVTQEQGQDLSIQHHYSGERELDASLNQSLNSALLSNLRELSDEDLGQYLADCEWQDIEARLKWSRQRSLEQDTKGLECLSFPTLTSGQNSSNKRPAGQTKLEVWFRNKGLIPNGSQLSSRAIALIMGFPHNWLEALGKQSSNHQATVSPTEPRAELEADTSQEERSHRHKQASLYKESFISIPCVIREPNKQPVKGLVVADNGLNLIVQVGQTKVSVNKLFVHPDFVMVEQIDLSPSKSFEKSRREKGEGSGYIHFRTVNKNGKDYKQAYYHWEEWEYGDRLIKSSKYIPRKMEAKIIRMNQEKVPVVKILEVLRSKAR